MRALVGLSDPWVPANKTWRCCCKIMLTCSKALSLMESVCLSCTLLFRMPETTWSFILSATHTLHAATLEASCRRLPSASNDIWAMKQLQL